MGDERIAEGTRDALKQLRHGLLRLHKVLLELERRDYERARGRINNSYEFLQLVLKDPWFDWLHRLSELIVQIDEALDSHDEAPTTEKDASELVVRAKTLLTPAESGSAFQKNYFLALQQSPDVVLLHSEVVRLMGK